MKKLSEKEKRYYRVKAALQEFCSLTDEEIAEIGEVDHHLSLMANMVCFYRDRGLEKLKEAVRKAALEAQGIPMIGPKRR